MSRPCVCDRIPPPGEPYTTAYCRLCWLYHHEPAYRNLWGDEPAPGLLQKAITFAGAVAQHVAGGMKQTDEAEYQRRVALCQVCPYLVDGVHCSKCGCTVVSEDKKVLNKARWAEQRCPIGKW